MSGTYEDLEVWREAMDDLVESVCTHTRDFPKQEQYCLTNQLRVPLCRSRAILRRARDGRLIENQFNSLITRAAHSTKSKPRSRLPPGCTIWTPISPML
jgi:hypothetical protein